MVRTLRWALPLAVVVLIGAAGLGVYQGLRGWFHREEGPNPVLTSASEAQLVVMTTQGGLLEVSTIDAPGEVLERSDPGRIGPLDLGTNVSHIRVAATYRYHIPLAPEWKMIRRGDQFIVVAPRIRPSLPVAIDTARTYQHTEPGWLRFDKAESGRVLERSVTAELGRRAASQGNINQQREVARGTVAQFVAKWLIQQEKWKGVSPAQVRVVFADEPVDKLGSEAVTFSGL